eukprot:7386677-Pyramimonas_sp.AAC.1
MDFPHAWFPRRTFIRTAWNARRSTHVLRNVRGLDEKNPFRGQSILWSIPCSNSSEPRGRPGRC